MKKPDWKTILKKKLEHGGFTIAETLITVLLLLLVSGGLAGGVRFATEKYNQAMAQSEAKVLMSTLTNILKCELGDARRITLEDGAGSVRPLKSYFSYVYGNKTALSELMAVEVGENYAFSESSDGYGELMLGTQSGGVIKGNLLLSSAAYSKYHLKAAANVTYDTAAHLFHVELKIKKPDGTILENDFDVLPLNTPTVET